MSSKAKVGDIAIGVEVDAGALRTGLNKSAKSLEKFGNQVREHSKRFAASFAVISAAAAASTVAIVNSQRKTIDALAKSADALAIATEKLQALNHLAELNGVSSEQMAKGLRRMERALGEAARKGGTTADALEDAGLSIQSIISLEPDQQIQAIANALSNINNQAVKASIASDLFGRDGINMLKVLTQLRKDGIEPTTEKLRELGIAISREDAAKVEAMNDALFTAQQALSGVANTVTIALAPYVEALANDFTDAARESGGFKKEVQEAFETALMTGAKFADFLQGLKVVFKGLELGVTTFGYAGVKVLQMQVKAISIFVDAAIKGINLMIDGLNKIAGLDVANIDMFSDSPFMRGLNYSATLAGEKVALLSGELHDLAMQPLPSDQVEQFLATVKQKANEAAQSVAAVAAGNISSGTDEEGSNVVPFKGPAVGGALNAANDEFGFGPIDDPFDPEQIAAKNEQLLQLERDFWTNKGAIIEHGLTSITGMIEANQGNQAGVYANSFASILASTATYSKKAFELNKKFSLGDAVIKGYESATSAWAWGMKLGGPPMAAAALAASVAKTAAQIKAIRSQKFGGGGSGSAGGGTGAGALPGASVPQQNNVQPVSTIVNMNIQGDSISTQRLGSLTEQLNKEYEAGYTLRVSA